VNASAAHAQFAAALLDPARALPAGLQGRDAQRRFAVHRNNVAASLVDALASGFPVLRALLGDDCFRAVALAYVRAHPPRSPLVWRHGATLPAFLSGRASTARLAYLPDIARLEFRRMQAFHASDAPPLPAAEFAALAMDADALASCRARLHPACRWMRSRHAVHAIWRAHQGDDGGDGLEHIDPDRAEDVLVLRPAFDVDTRLAPPGGVTLLQALQQGRAIGDAIAVALDEPDAALDDLLSLLIAPGVLAALEPYERLPSVVGAAMAAKALGACDQTTETHRGHGRSHSTSSHGTRRDRRPLRRRHDEDTA
jgi:hypothetical protein